MLVTFKGKGLLPMSDLWFVRNDFINSLRKMVTFWACWWRRERCLFVLLWVWDNGKSLSPHEDLNQRPWDHQSAESEDLRFDSLRWLRIFFLCSKLMRRQRNIFFSSYNALHHYLNVGKTSSICWSWLGQRNFQQVWKSSLHQVGAEILLKILTTVCHTNLMMLVGRIWFLSWSLVEIKGLTTVELAKLDCLSGVNCYLDL